MKSDKEKELEQKKFNKDIHKEQTKGLMWTLQIILIFPVIGFLITSIFIRSYYIWAEILLILTLLVMAYNNKIYFKRKNASILYIIMAILFLIDIIIGFIYNG